MAVTPFRQPAGQVDADDVRGQDIDGLAEHSRLGLDAADAPAHDAEAVDHGRVRVRADEGVGVVHPVLRQHALGEVLEIDLVHDADPRRHDLEAAKRLHAPLEELVAGAVALELDPHVRRERVGGGPLVHLHRVVHDEGHRDERLDHLRVPAEGRDGRPHGREVHEEGHAREVLEDDPRDHEGDLGGALGPRLPGRQGAHVVFLDPLAVAVAQQGLENDPDGHRKAPDSRHPDALELRKRVVRPGAARRKRKRLLRPFEISHRGYRITRLAA